MQLTDQQRAEIDRQRREQPGQRRFVLSFTPEQREQYRQAVNTTRARPAVEALREATFSGWLRRAIASSGCSQENLAADVGAEVAAINAFLRGEGTLDSALIDRLIARLGLAPQLEEAAP
jgi:ribosome-binding protein aMBF1 (putative translation factor)